LLTNNPTAIAIHESQLLWPTNCLQCVVSVGTGKYEPTGNIGLPMSKTSLKSKVAKIVQSATDTEGEMEINTCYYLLILSTDCSSLG